MFSTAAPPVNPTKYKSNGTVKSQTQTRPIQGPNRFSVRVFKAPTLPAFPYAQASKIDLGYRPSHPGAEQGQQAWYPSRYGDVGKYYPSSDESFTKTSRTSSTNNTGVGVTNRSYEQQPKIPTNFSIYPNATNGIYIYEQSICSKSDLLSVSEYDSTSQATFPPSPAMSTDSTVTLKSPESSERTLTDSHPARPSSAMFRPPHQPYVSSTTTDPQQHVNRNTRDYRESLPGSGDGHRPRSSGDASQERKNAPFRLSSMPTVPENDARIGYPPTEPPHTDIHYYESSINSEAETDDVDAVARLNAEYNATSSASFYAGNDDSYRRNRTSPVPLPDIRADARQHPYIVADSTSRNPPSKQTSNVKDDYTFNTSKYSPLDEYRRNRPAQTNSRVASQPLDETDKFIPAFGHDEWDKDVNYKQNHRMSQNEWSAEQARQPTDFPSSHPLINSNLNATTTSDYVGNISYDDRALPVPPPVPRQRTLYPEYRTSVAGPRPDTSSTKSVANNQTASTPPYQSSWQNGNIPDRSPPTVIFTERREAQNVTSARRNPNGSLASGTVETPQYQPENPEYRPFSSSYLEDSQLKRDPSIGDPAHSRPGRVDNPYQNTRNSSNLSSSRQFVENPVIPLTLSPEMMSDEAHISPTQNAAPRSQSRSGPTPTATPKMTRSSPQTQTYATKDNSIPKYTQHTNAADSIQSHHTEESKPSNYPVYPHPDKRGYRTDSRQPILDYPTHPTQRGNTTYQNVINSSLPQSKLVGQYVVTSNATRGETKAERTDAPSSRPRMIPITEPAPTHTEPHRRLSDGDRPYNNGPVSQSGVESIGRLPTAAGTINSIYVAPEPQRRFSDGDQNVSYHSTTTTSSGRASAPPTRTVRWTENLVCPSPIFACQRRKGWFNRRGDQLWTNDGAYKPVTPGEEYPPDLDEYPEFGEGWMNEECVRINMEHRLMPKAPLRSALKQTVKA